MTNPDIRTSTLIEVANALCEDCRAGLAPREDKFEQGQWIHTVPGQHGIAWECPASIVLNILKEEGYNF